MAYEFDFHLAKCLDKFPRETREKREKLDMKEYRFYRKRIYALTKWMIQHRHQTEFSKNVPDGLSRPLTQGMKDMFDEYMTMMIKTMKLDDRIEAIQVDEVGEISQEINNCVSVPYDLSASSIGHAKMEQLNQLMMQKPQVPVDKQLGIQREKREKREKSIFPTMKHIQLDDIKYKTKRVPQLERKPILKNTHEKDTSTTKTSIEKIKNYKNT